MGVHTFVTFYYETICLVELHSQDAAVKVRAHSLLPDVSSILLSLVVL